MRNLKPSLLASLGLVFLATAAAPAIGFAAFELVDRERERGNFLFEDDPRSLVTTIDLVFFSGSVHDPKGKEGLAGLAFDALLRGTKKKSRDEFANAVESLGASISAGTSYLRTQVSLSVINENLDAALALLAEAVLEPGMRKEEFARLQAEKLAQLNQQRSSPPRVMFRALRQELYRGTPLAHYPDGTIDSLKRVKLADARTFLARQIVSGNVIVGVSSKLDRARVKTAIARAFAQLPNGPAMPLPDLRAPKITGRQLVVLEKRGLTTVPAGIVHPTVGSTYPHFHELTLGDFILGGGMTSRLFNVLRNENGWTYGAQSSFFQLDLPRRYGGLYTLYTFPATEHALKAIPRMVELYQEFVAHGLTAEELEFAKNSLVNSYAFEFVAASNRLSSRLSETLDGFPYLDIDEYTERMRKVSLGELGQWIKTAHDPENFVLGIAADPALAKEIAAKIPGVKAIKIVKDPIQKLQ